jgi:hypothetical protein
MARDRSRHGVVAGAWQFSFMRRIRFTKKAIDTLAIPQSDTVYWDDSLSGFGVKVTPKGRHPKGRKVFLVLYPIGGAGSKLRKYTIGPYGRLTLHQARLAAQKVFAARLDGRDPAKREAKRKVVADRVEDLLETFIASVSLKTARRVTTCGLTFGGGQFWAEDPA